MSASQIKDSMHLDSVGLGNPVKRTCATCHGMHMTGMDTANGWMYRHDQPAVVTLLDVYRAVGSTNSTRTPSGSIANTNRPNAR